MWKGVVIFAYIIVALCYFPVALVGYWAFGNSVEDNVLISLCKRAWLIAAASMFVVIYVIGSYQSDPSFLLALPSLLLARPVDGLTRPSTKSWLRPSTLEKPSKKPMWKGVVIFAYIIVALCYFPVALVGYWAFGNSVEDNVLISLCKAAWLIAAANMFVVIHVIGSYQIYAMPVFEMIETVLVKKLHFTPCFSLRLVSRSLYVAFTCFVAITFPFFGGLLGFFGGFAFVPTTYFLPCIMWLAVYKPKRFSLSWITNWICIILGVLLMVLSPIGGLRQISVDAKTYKFYS
ncbi:Lysine histidine transporter 1 [Nymphaea thermarum]|nr:Lysine histidine transporter 1 [Nymphaea thermarum]